MSHKRQRRASDAPSFQNPFKYAPPEKYQSENLLIDNKTRRRVNGTASEEQAETRMNRWLDGSLPLDGMADVREGDAVRKLHRTMSQDPVDTVQTDAMSHLSPTAQEQARPTRKSSPARPQTPTSAAREHESWEAKRPWPANPSMNQEEDQASSPHSSDVHMV